MMLSGQKLFEGIKKSLAQSRPIKRQLEIIVRLQEWQKRSKETCWVIGEYLAG